MLQMPPNNTFFEALDSSTSEKSTNSTITHSNSNSSNISSFSSYSTNNSHQLFSFHLAPLGHENSTTTYSTSTYPSGGEDLYGTTSRAASPTHSSTLSGCLRMDPCAPVPTWTSSGAGLARRAAADSWARSQSRQAASCRTGTCML